MSGKRSSYKESKEQLPASKKIKPNPNVYNKMDIVIYADCEIKKEADLSKLECRELRMNLQVRCCMKQTGNKMGAVSIETSPAGRRRNYMCYPKCNILQYFPISNISNFISKQKGAETIVEFFHFQVRFQTRFQINFQI